MAQKIVGRERQPEVKTHDLPLIGAAPNRQSTVNHDDGDWILAVVARALDAVMQRKEAALSMGIDAGQMARQLRGDGHLSLRRLGCLPERFWRAFDGELRAHLGLDSQAEQLDSALRSIAEGVATIGGLARRAVLR